MRRMLLATTVLLLPTTLALAEKGKPVPPAAGDGGFVLPPEPPTPGQPDKDKKPAGDATKPATDATKPAATDAAKPAADAAAPAVAAPAIPAAPAPAAPTAPRPARQILKQLVGNEELTVWMRVDLLLFRDDVKLPGEEPK